jgi:NAD(P)-dependent dehydrogenase (short-subunit alcohol dehydrogenase family)
MAPRIFLVTGSSTGFGKEYVQQILAKGDYVAATARKASELTFDHSNDKNLLLVDLDVTSKESINQAFAATLKRFGRIDVVCNNAGYGLSGEFESLSDKQIRTQMEVNFFGLIDVTRKAMEVMRDQKPAGGLIQQVTSIGGQRGVPTFSIYCASKWVCNHTSFKKKIHFFIWYYMTDFYTGRRRLHRGNLTRSQARMEY